MLSPALPPSFLPFLLTDPVPPPGSGAAPFKVCRLSHAYNISPYTLPHGGDGDGRQSGGFTLLIINHTSQRNEPATM